MDERTIVFIPEEGQRVLKIFSGNRNGGRASEQEAEVEIAALAYLSRVAPDLIPKVFWLGQYTISSEKVGVGRPRQFTDTVRLLERVQAVPIEEAVLPVAKPEDYFRQAKSKLDDLGSVGGVSGITRREKDQIISRYEQGLPAFAKFGNVLVHGDFQSQHIGERGHGHVLIDWEQARIGSELEDPVFYAVRHPTSASLVRDYLFQKYCSDPIKSNALPRAYDTMTIDRLIHIWHWNRFKREGALAAAKSAYVRLALNVHPAINGSIPC